MGNGGNGRKLFALWQKIMQDAKPLRNGTCSPQDVKQLVYHLENISSKVEPRPAVGMSSAPRLRGENRHVYGGVQPRRKYQANQSPGAGGQQRLLLALPKAVRIHGPPTKRCRPARGDGRADVRRR